MAIRELNNLHRLWKNDLGPVARNKREELWNRFQVATKQIHDKKNSYIKNIDSIRIKNLEIKSELITQINTISEKKIDSHSKWQESINLVEEIKNKFISTGKVPREKNKQIWDMFRDATRNFNKEKNKFYKNLKDLEKKSIALKVKLIEEVNQILEKKIGEVIQIELKKFRLNEKKWQVSRKHSEKLWTEFKIKTNNFFEKIKGKKQDFNDQQKEIVKIQKEFLNNLKNQEIPQTPKKYEAFILKISENWFEIRNNDLGNQEKLIINFLFENWNNISLAKNKLELKKYETKLLFIQNDKQSFDNEHSIIKKKIEDLTNELNQLENNLDFFSESSSNNPLLTDVNDKINKLNNEKLIVENKLKLVKLFINQNLKGESK